MEACFTFIQKVNQQETPHKFYHSQFSKQSLSSTIKGAENIPGIFNYSMIISVMTVSST